MSQCWKTFTKEGVCLFPISKSALVPCLRRVFSDWSVLLVVLLLFLDPLWYLERLSKAIIQSFI